MLRSSKGIKRATVIPIPTPLQIQPLGENMQKMAFKECTPSALQSWGFIPPDDEKKWPILAECQGKYVITIRHDRRTLNKGRLSRLWHKAIRDKEEAEKRKLQKAERDALRDDTMAKMAAQTPPSESIYQAIYDPSRSNLIVLEANASIVDWFVERINRVIKDQNQEITYTSSSAPPALESSLTTWVFRPKELPGEAGFAVGTYLRLANKTNKAVLTNQEANTPEVREHLHGHKCVEQVALVWEGKGEGSEEVSFVLSSKRVLSQIRFKEYVKESEKQAQAESGDDIKLGAEATFLVYLSAFYDLWDAVCAIPEEY